MLICISIAASALTSLVVTRIIVARYFKNVDSYVKGMRDLTDKANEKTLEAIERLENIPVLRVDEEALYKAVQRGRRKVEARENTEKFVNKFIRD